MAACHLAERRRQFYISVKPLTDSCSVLQVKPLIAKCDGRAWPAEQGRRAGGERSAGGKVLVQELNKTDVKCIEFKN